MLNKGFKFFGQGSSKKFQLTAQKVPWPFILSRIDAVKQAFFQQPLLILRRQIETITRHKFRHIPWLRSFQTRFYEKIPSGRFQNIRYGYLAGAALIAEKKSSFDWEKERVSVSESRNYFGHIKECHEIQKKKPDEECEWALFLEKQDITVWRREHSTMKGIYEYKMYGNFDDVSADEFLFNQLDMSEFRLSWDKNTAQAVVIDKDEESQDGGIVYYWEVNWPRFFSNRDYCCYRQTAEDPETGTVMVLSKSVDHPKCPNNKRTWRVKDYFSTLIVKPHTTSDKPGLEFCLTGYEDPGLQLPESIITWVAVRGMPEFMINLRAACLKLREQQQLTSNQCKKEPESVKESPRNYQENYQQSMSGQTRMYA